VIESCRHFIRVMSDMCELCYGVSTTDHEGPFWISCDVCDKWYHGPCAGLSHEVPHYTCPKCVRNDPKSSPDKVRIAHSLLMSLPPPKHNPIPDPQRIREAEVLTMEAKAQPIVVSLNPIELQTFKKIAPVGILD